MADSSLVNVVGHGVPGGVQLASVDELMDFLGDPAADAHKRTVTLNGVTRCVKGLKICGHCKAGYGINPPFPSDGKRCGGCRNIHYCNETCQRADWRRHKKVCATYSQARENCLFHPN